MDKELEKYYEAYFDLFNTKGWKQFLADLNDNAINLNDVSSIKDANELFYRKGKLEALTLILNFKAYIENAYKEVQDESLS
jgi:hypothetical protein